MAREQHASTYPSARSDAVRQLGSSWTTSPSTKRTLQAAQPPIAQEKGIALAETIAIGDGANDLLMVETAGLGVAYHAKPKLADAADMRIRRGDLTVLLHALGIPRAAWATA